MSILWFGILALLVASPVFSAESKKKKEIGSYIVLMEEAPMAVYRGGVAGFAATAPVKGRKLMPHSTAARSYTRYLDSRHDGAMRSAGMDPGMKIHDYHYAANGFSARLTPAQARRLARQPGVLSVRRDTLLHLTTTHTPESANWLIARPSRGR